MAGSLSGIGGQQIPAANTFKPGEQQVRQQDQQAPADDTNKSSETQNTQRFENVLESRQAEASRTDSSESAEQRRGSVLDITV